MYYCTTITTVDLHSFHLAELKSMSIEHNFLLSPFSPASSLLSVSEFDYYPYLLMRKVYSTDLFMFSVSLWFSLGRSRVFRKFVHSMHIVKLFGMQLLIVLSYNPFYFYKIVGSKSQEFLRWNTGQTFTQGQRGRAQTAQMGGWQVKWTEKLFMVLVIGASRWVDLHTCLPES